MDRNEYEGDKYIPSESSNIANSTKYNSKISRPVEQGYAGNLFHLVSSLSQIVLGSSVLFLSMLGLIQPLWLSTMLAMVASMSCMAGLYLLYSVTVRDTDPNRLLRNAIKRIMDSQN